VTKTLPEVAMIRVITLMLLSFSVAACGGSDPGPSGEGATTPAATARPGLGAVAYVDARIWDGTGGPVRTDAALVVRNGRVEGLMTNVPEGAEIVSLDGRWIVPGLINTHGHVSGRWAADDISEPAERVRGDLSLYARYGVTTVLSLGGEPDEAFALRGASPSRDYARLFAAGEVVADVTPAAATATANANIALGADWMKLRVDDNLGSGTKMPWEAVQATIDAAKAADIPVATHIFYMEDAARLLIMGSGLIAHSVRDQAVSDDFVLAMLDAGICYVPTLVREVSTFVYSDRPDWFDDPFFLEAAQQSEIERVSQPDFRAQVAASPAAAGYRRALVQAQDNLRVLVGSGVPVAFGTDSGPPGRFPGYFEHLEIDLMREAGLTSREILLSATSVAANCLALDEVGTLEPGKWADFIVLGEDPLADIGAMRMIEGVYISGNPVAR
jgi:imidazolonepropionase-like amidohydrolase